MPDTNTAIDDATNTGLNTAPAVSSADINLNTAGSASGNGQKANNTQAPNNPVDTSLRRWNPLSKLSSYTYNVSLYMITPEAANWIAENGTLPEDIENGAYYIIAQSGGINTESEPRGITLDRDSTPGPGKPGYDYYIEDLNISITLIAADGSKTSTIASGINFKIIEPSGFTFLSRLSKLSAIINERSPMLAAANPAARPNLYQQQYLLAIRFYGYDENGNPVETNMVPDSNRALNDKWALYERIFPIIVQSFKTKISDKSTTYELETNALPIQAAYGEISGTNKNPINIDGATVGQILGSLNDKNPRSLISVLNARQVDLKNQKKTEKIQTYDIKWINNEWFDSSKIFNSLMITDTDYAKETSSMAQVNTPQDVTVAESVKSNTINTRSKTINVPGGVSIVSVIDQIIVKSEYVVNALIKKNNQRIETQTLDNTEGKLQWYAVRPTTKISNRDYDRKDWVYNITYEIGPYEVPYIKNEYVGARSKYYGPVKRYDYLFTGKNTEVISFEQEYNNLFYIITAEGVTSDNISQYNTVSNSVPRAVGKSDSNPTMGTLNRGTAIAESVRASLYNPSEQAVATMRIIGDPDLIMDTIGRNFESDTFGKFYGKNHSINPYGGQIFTEIIFKTAEDYKQDGLFNVTPDQSINFYPFETQKLIGNTGIIYKITKVDSYFNRGKFEQTLHLIMVPPDELIIQEPTSAREQFNKFERTEENKQYSSGTRIPVANEQATIRRIDNAIEKSNPSQSYNSSTSLGSYNWNIPDDDSSFWKSK